MALLYRESAAFPSSTPPCPKIQHYAPRPRPAWQPPFGSAKGAMRRAAKVAAKRARAAGTKLYVVRNGKIPNIGITYS